MSRSGYSEGLDPWELIRWRGQVASATRGARGQKMLRDLLEALDTMSEKALITHDLENKEGAVCALGALGRARKLDMTKVDQQEPEEVAAMFGIAHQLAQEIVYENDEGHYGETPAQRWARMRAWTAAQITPVTIEVRPR